MAQKVPDREPNLMALTILKVKHAKPGRHVDGRGLCLVVKPSGARTWVLRMQHNGRRRDYGLGSALDVVCSTLDTMEKRLAISNGNEASE